MNTYIHMYLYICIHTGICHIFDDIAPFQTVFKTPPLAEDTAMMRLVCFSPGHPWFLRAKPQMIQYKAVSIYIFALMQLIFNRFTALEMTVEVFK